MSTTTVIPERISFSEQEVKTQEKWREGDIFKRSQELSAGRPAFTFYDGPPFATGMPHYGHILAGTIKDTVTRYAYATGHDVPRRFGWDCHGLPIEFEIEKKLGIKTKDDVLALGIDKYNAECRAIVMRFASEWETVVNRMGRWIDFENDYKTLDTSFMESVWWVFKQLYERDLVYQGFRVMPYSTGCTTPLSNFEANQNYKDTPDPAVTVSFPLVDEPDTLLLAWTTTPWTLPSNVALCVNDNLDYVKIFDQKAQVHYVLAESRLVQLYKKGKGDFKTVSKFKGSELVGRHYSPIFDYFTAEYGSTAFRVVSDDYVSSESGTGIVHQAPAFGEDDYRVCLAKGIITKDQTLPCPIDANGRFVSPVEDYAGVNVKDADKAIMATLKEKGRLVKADSIIHNYPFCWRSDTPLIYRAVPSWFVKVESLKDRLVENNKKSTWVPVDVQTKRFGNWLENARDWNISRNRYWGTPIPIWRNDDTGEIYVVGSVKELEDLSGLKNITDLHRDTIDDIRIRSPKTGDELRRVEEVFDCWFESGSMPYAQSHYPFSMSDNEFASKFPADFIAEGLDQTRGWFYTLMVLSTALFDKPAFKNCVVNGLVLASDGKKMSKRLQNYPDPMKVVGEHGADPLRLYLINSPVVRGEELRFKEEGVRDVVRDVMLPWFNSFRFLFQNSRQLTEATGVPLMVEPRDTRSLESSNQMDMWIQSRLASLISSVKTEMGAYRLYAVVPRLLDFIDQLTNWYVRLNRPRLKGQFGDDEDWRLALRTLAEVLVTLSQLMSPFTPYFAEYTYQHLIEFLPEDQRQDSVHFLMVPESRQDAVDTSFETAVSYMQQAIENGRIGRDRRKIGMRQPLAKLTVVHRDRQVLEALKSLESYIVSEVNVRQIDFVEDESAYVTLRADADGKMLGKRLGKAFREINNQVRSLSSADLIAYESSGSKTFDVNGTEIVLSGSDLRVVREIRKDLDTEKTEAVITSGTLGILVLLDVEIDAELVQERMAREFVSRVQKLRKKAKLEPADLIEVFYEASDEKLTELVRNKGAGIAESLRTPELRRIGEHSSSAEIIIDEQVESVDDAELRLLFTRSSKI